MTHSPAIAIVPVKALADAKGRLAGAMEPAARRRLVAAMLDAVLDACAACRHVDEVLVVAGDHDAAALAAHRPVRVLVEPAAGLNVALVTADAATAGAGTTVVVAADLPRIRAEDLDDVFAAAAGSARAVVVAPTVDGGTAVLLRRPAAVIPTAYGPGSASAHVALADAAGVPAAVVDNDNLAHDVDTPAQLAALGDAVVASRSD
jgi:2-phospho-L-lactate/phosphoenolpyruvate guanylyltransferase